MERCGRALFSCICAFPRRPSRKISSSRSSSRSSCSDAWETRKCTRTARGRTAPWRADRLLASDGLAGFFVKVEFYGPTGHYGRDGMLVNHLAYRIFQEDDELVERFDL